jgi:hypothetical protein
METWSSIGDCSEDDNFDAITRFDAFLHPTVTTWPAIGDRSEDVLFKVWYRESFSTAQQFPA